MAGHAARRYRRQIAQCALKHVLEAAYLVPQRLGQRVDADARVSHRSLGLGGGHA